MATLKPTHHQGSYVQRAKTAHFDSNLAAKWEMKFVPTHCLSFWTEQGSEYSCVRGHSNSCSLCSYCGHVGHQERVQNSLCFAQRTVRPHRCMLGPILQRD